MQITKKNLFYQIDLFSRTFDKVNYANALKIYKKLQKKGYPGSMPRVHTLELYDKAF